MDQSTSHDLSYPEMLALFRVRCYELTKDKTYLTKPYYETSSSEPDFTIPEMAMKMVNEEYKK